MKDEDKSTEQRLNELERLRRRVAELEGTQEKPLCTKKARGESEEKLRLLQENVPSDYQSLDQNERMLKKFLGGFTSGDMFEPGSGNPVGKRRLANDVRI